MAEPSGKERRKHVRVDMGLPVRVQGRDPDGSTGRTRHRGAESLPAELLLMPGDPAPEERRRFPRWSLRLGIKVESGYVPPGSSGQEP